MFLAAALRQSQIQTVVIVQQPGLWTHIPHQHLQPLSRKFTASALFESSGLPHSCDFLRLIQYVNQWHPVYCF